MVVLTNDKVGVVFWKAELTLLTWGLNLSRSTKKFSHGCCPNLDIGSLVVDKTSNGNCPLLTTSVHKVFNNTILCELMSVLPPWSLNLLTISKVYSIQVKKTLDHWSIRSSLTVKETIRSFRPRFRGVQKADAV